MRKIGIIDVPSSAGARRTGQERAPQAFRQAGFIEHLQSAGLEVIDFGDPPEVLFQPDQQHPKAQNLQLVVEVAQRVANQVEGAVSQHVPYLTEHVRHRAGGVADHATVTEDVWHLALDDANPLWVVVEPRDLASGLLGHQELVLREGRVIGLSMLWFGTGDNLGIVAGVIGRHDRQGSP